MIRRAPILLLLFAANVATVEARQPAPAVADTVVYFSPWDDAEGALVAAIREARRQVLVQAYLLTSRTIARELIAAHERGVDVRVLADAAQAGRGNDRQLQALATAGVPVALEDRYAAAHHKVMVVDAEAARPVLLTGSYNFTWAAQARNAENLLRVRGDAPLARRYAANWLRHCADAAPLPPATAVPPRLCFEGSPPRDAK